MLYEAALNGCVVTLNNIIQKDPLILNRVSLSNFSETPLHVLSLAGHLDFTVAILQRCPKMAMERDSIHRLPIHMASAKGHTEIIKALLFYNGNHRDVCLARDEDGRTPLHLAAIRGRVDLIRDLVTAYPGSTTELLDGDTVFHLCVKYNKLETLKLLVEIVDDDALLNRGNRDGNTILHLSVMLKEFEVTRYLLSLSEVKEKVNALNNQQLTPLDLVYQSPLTDLKTVKIRDILTLSGAKKATDLNNNNNNLPYPMPNSAITSTNSSTSKSKLLFKKFLKFIEYEIEETRGALMIVETVIGTISYQTTMNPPGGVWQQNSNDSTTGFGCNATNTCEAGTSVLGQTNPDQYQIFLISNTLAFFGSLVVISMVVNGFPLKNKFCVWLLANALMLTLIFFALSYVSGMVMVVPSESRDGIRFLSYKMFYLWSGFLLVTDLIDIFRFAVWITRKLQKCWQKCKNNRRMRTSRACLPENVGCLIRYEEKK